MTDDPITSFSGQYAFLSNFYPCSIEVDEDVFPTNEHAFQAFKTDDPAERQKIRDAKTPASAKSLGKPTVSRRTPGILVRWAMQQSVRRLASAASAPSRSQKKTLWKKPVRCSIYLYLFDLKYCVSKDLFLWRGRPNNFFYFLAKLRRENDTAVLGNHLGGVLQPPRGCGWVCSFQQGDSRRNVHDIARLAFAAPHNKL